MLGPSFFIFRNQMAKLLRIEFILPSLHQFLVLAVRGQ
jgi:hypothetical protein